MIKTIVVQQTLEVRVLFTGQKCLLRNTQTGPLRERVAPLRSAERCF